MCRIVQTVNFITIAAQSAFVELFSHRDAWPDFHTAGQTGGTKDVRKFYSEKVPTKLKDFDIRKLEGKWHPDGKLPVAHLALRPAHTCPKVQSPRVQQKV